MKMRKTVRYLAHIYTKYIITYKSAYDNEKDSKTFGKYIQNVFTQKSVYDNEKDSKILGKYTHKMYLHTSLSIKVIEKDRKLPPFLNI